jgi:glycosyltransferase involved in cell wall biosynthesis
MQYTNIIILKTILCLVIDNRIMLYNPTILSFTISSMPEFFGNAGPFINPNYVSELSNGMYNLLMNDDFSYQLREKALFKAREFTWKETARKTLDVYRRVLKGE